MTSIQFCNPKLIEEQKRLEGEQVMNSEKCPVCDWAINDGGIKVQVGGKEITVCCDECVEKVKQSPEQFAAA